MSAMDDRITVEINDCEVEKVDSVKSLGVYIDKHLNWSTHFEKISKKIASAIFSTTPFRIKLRHNLSNINISASIYPPFK